MEWCYRGGVTWAVLHEIVLHGGGVTWCGVTWGWCYMGWGYIEVVLSGGGVTLSGADGMLHGYYSVSYIFLMSPLCHC